MRRREARGEARRLRRRKKRGMRRRRRRNEDEKQKFHVWKIEASEAGPTGGPGSNRNHIWEGAICESA
eukprot:5399968-Pyramimonas_sp.AAC.1